MTLDNNLWHYGLHMTDKFIGMCEVICKAKRKTQYRIHPHYLIRKL